MPNILKFPATRSRKKQPAGPTHLELHQAFQYILWDHASHDEEKMAEHRKKLLSDRTFWGPVLVSGFRHLANDRLRTEICHTATQDLLDATSKTLTGATELANVTDEFFATTALSMIDDDRREAKQPDFDNLVYCASLVNAFDQPAGSVLAEADMLRLLDGLGFTLLFHPNFFEKSQRGPMLVTFADEVAKDILGPWPKGT